MSTSAQASIKAATQFERRLFIGARWVSGQGELFSVLNPGTEETLAKIAGASEAQVAAAIAAARKAYDAGVWSELSALQRAETMRKFVAYLSSQSERLIDLAVREAGCPLGSGTMAAQVPRPLQQGFDAIDLFLKLPDFEENPLPMAERITPRGVAQSLRRYAPVGVVAAISAYNFPLYTNLWKVVPALLTGNCVILRPNPLTPLGALIFGEAAEAAGLPPGVLNVVTDPGAMGGVLLSTHPDVDMVAFTGSTPVGKQVAIQSTATMKRLQLELGGKSAQIYMPDSVADSHNAAAQVCMGHAGQGCTHGTRIFVPEAQKAEVLEAMAATLRKHVKLGDPSDPGTNMGPVISAAQRDRCQRYVDLAVEAGAKVVCGGKRPASQPRGFFFEPTILDVPDNRNPAAQEEIFGPVVCVIGYRDLDHAVEMANDSPYGLAGYVYGKDRQQALAVATRLRTGTVQINGGVHSAYVSMGGWRSSGVGRERGVEGLRIYQQIQAVNILG